MDTNEQEVDLNIDETVETTDDNGSDTTDWKAEALKAQGIAKRFQTKLEKAKLESKVDAKVEKKLEEKGLDRLDRIFLRQEGIKSDAEIKLAEDWVKETGRDLERVVDSKAFQAELKELRDSVATKEATPSNSKRSTQSPRTEVDYWLSKGELPKDNPELARDVVNARMKREEMKSQFADQAVIK